MVDLVLATGNAGKVDEIRNIIHNVNLKLLDLKTFPDLHMPPETGVTYEENALIKAQHVLQATQLPVLADDSGLEVDALEGRPGLYSARYAGDDTSHQEKCMHLLNELNGLPFEKRSARFMCCLALCAPEQQPIICHGQLEGHIVDSYCGEKGFGYDPIFQPCGYDKTMAELSFAQKNQISHRAVALHNLIKRIRINEDTLMEC